MDADPQATVPIHVRRCRPFPRRGLCWLLLLAVLGTGCRTVDPEAGNGDPSTVDSTEASASSGSPEGEEPGSEPAPEEERRHPWDVSVGRVLSVDEEAGFVVVDFALHRIPSPGDRLVVVRDGEPIVELRVTNFVRGYLAAASVTDSSTAPVPGDRVREVLPPPTRGQGFADQSEPEGSEESEDASLGGDESVGEEEGLSAARR